MDTEDILHDLLEREGICQHDGKQLITTAKTLARQQLIEDLKSKGYKSYQATFKIKEVKELEGYEDIESSDLL